MTAGDGADEIILGDWLAGGETTAIMDYTSADDSVVLVWDDASADSVEPRITLGSDLDENNVAQTLVMLDGTVVATVNGTDLTVDDIALIPLSTATLVGLSTA